MVASDNPPSRKRSEPIEVHESSGNVFADLGLPNPEAELRAADARIAGLAEPIEVTLSKLVNVVARAADRHGPGVAEALQAVREAVRDQPPQLVGRSMSTAPRDGFAFLVTGVHERDDPPGAERGVKAGMPWWGIALYDIWREPHRFVFAKDGTALWSEPRFWCVLPNLVAPEQPSGTRYSLALPGEMTPAIREVLGLPNFRTGPIAHAYRAAGHPIRTKMEDEQAFVLFRFLRFALEHGPGWFAESCIDLEAAVATAKAKKAAEGTAP